MADISLQTLKVLRAARELAAFTMPQLTDASGASYETVKRVLRQDENGLFERTGDKVVSAVGRPAEVWKVANEAALTTRLHQAGQTLEESELPPGETGLGGGSATTPETASLAAAEDNLLFALHADGEDDIADFAQQALEELNVAGLSEIPTSAKRVEIGQRRNLPSQEARAWVVGEVARYLLGGEGSGLAGPQWRRAVAAIAAVEVPGASAIHKRLLVALVRIAIERAERKLADVPVKDLEQEIISSLVAASGTADLWELAEMARAGSVLDRETLRAATAQVLAKTATRDDGVGREEILSWLEMIPVIFSPAHELSEATSRSVTDALCTWIRRGDRELAVRGAEALAAIHSPRDLAFWHDLAAAETAAITPAEIFEVLGTTDVGAAFLFLRSSLGEPSSLREAREMLVQALPALEAKSGQRAREALGEFLVSLPLEERAFMSVAPGLAGLEPAPIGRALRRRFFSVLADWSAIAQGDREDPAIAGHIRTRGIEVRELAIEVRDVLSLEELARAREVLSEDTATPETAAVTVPAALALGGEAIMAQHLVDLAARTEEPWRFLANWYLDVCPRDDLVESEREKLFNEVLTHLRATMQDTPFLMTLAQCAAESGVDLPELTESGLLPPWVGFELERTMTCGYDNTMVVEDLKEIAAAAA